jgi:phosphoribosyl-ATP pyrophosphohydrolase
VSEENILGRLDDVIVSRKGAPLGESYVAMLLQGDESKVLKKIGEESVELVIAIRDKNKQSIIHEAADLWFHSLVALARHNITGQEVLNELNRRFGVSGYEEKESRSKNQ